MRKYLLLAGFIYRSIYANLSLPPPTCDFADITSKNSILFLIDVWEEHSGEEASRYMEKITKEKIAPLVQFFQKKSIPVFHFAHSRREAFVLDYLLGNGNVFRDYDIREIIEMLKGLGIRNIFYVGFAANMCVLDRKAGIRFMKSEGFNCILVQDATFANRKKITDGDLIKINKNFWGQLSPSLCKTTMVEELMLHFDCCLD